MEVAIYYNIEVDEFNTKYNTDCSIKTFTQNIPNVLIQSMKNNLLNITTPILHKIKTDYADLVNEKYNNKFLRQYLVNILHPGRTRSTLVLRDFDKSEISTIRKYTLKQ